jgi:hypothetical protein
MLGYEEGGKNWAVGAFPRRHTYSPEAIERLFRQFQTGDSRKSPQISADSQPILSPLSYIVSYLSYKSSTGYGEGGHIGAGTE